MMTYSTTSLLAILVMTLTIRFSKSPMKILMLMLTLSATISLNLSLTSGEIWFPVIYFLIFSGGVMIMLVLVSSIMPNSNTGKHSKTVTSSTLIMCILTMAALSMQEGSIWSSSLKSVLTDQASLQVMMLMILTYFFLFTWVFTTGLKTSRI